MITTGVDVSRHQGLMDWAVTKAQGICFCAIRATVGNYDWIDPRCLENVEGAKEQGIYWTLYHVIKPNHGVEIQIDRLFAAVEQTGRSDYPLVLDVELEGGQSQAVINQKTEACLQLIEERDGRRPLFYSRPSFVIDVMGSPDFLEDYDLWLAHYTNGDPWIPPPWTDWLFWQWSADHNNQGSKYGASSDDIDLDRYNGTKEDFEARYILPSLEERVELLEVRVDILEESLFSAVGDIGKIENWIKSFE
ncbi:MAG: glycoside hydrolase family 25 protein [Candidatus Thorarchaeota archaeon]